MSTLYQRMRVAADTVEKLSAMHGYRYPEEAGLSANELRKEAKYLEKTSPVTDYSACSDACYLEDDQ